jgi:hypothetical protein
VGKKISLALALLWLVGCSSQMAYNHLDWLVLWYVDDYVELNTEQEEKLNTSLESLLIWHRKVELPVYHNQLSNLLADVNSGDMQASLWRSHIVQIRGHMSRVRNKASRGLTQLAEDLSADQVTELFKNLHTKNTESEEEFNDLSGDEVQEQRLEKLYDTFDDFLGSVSKQQMAIIQRYINDTSSNTLAYIQFNKTLQGMAKDLFKHFSGPLLNEKLYDLFIQSQQLKSVELKKNSALKTELAATLLSDIYGTLSNKQLVHFKAEITALQLTLSELIAVGA